MLKLATNNGFHELLLNFNFPMLKKWPWFKLFFLFKKRNLYTPINDIKKMDLWLLIKSEKKIDFQIKMILWCIFNGIQKQYIDLILKLSWEIYSWEISIASVQVCFWLYPDNVFD
jgi:hypothetical protein